MNIGYIENQKGKEWRQETVEISSMLAGLIKARRSFLREDE